MKQYHYLRPLLTAFLFSVCIGAMTQTNKAIPTTFGLSAGITFSNVSASGGSFAHGAGQAGGINANIFMAVPVNRSFAIRPEIGYIMLGSTNNTDHSTFHADYCQMPILAQFTIGMPDLHILAGPQLGLLFSSSRTDHGLKSDLDNELPIRDFSCVAGIEYLPGPMGISLRYQYSFSNFNDTGDRYTARNTAISLNAMVRF